MAIEDRIILPSMLQGRSIHTNVIPTMCNLRNMLDKLFLVNGDVSQLEQWEQQSYKAYNLEEIQIELLQTSNDQERIDLIRNHILNGEPVDFGANCIDIYLVAYVAEMFGPGRQTFFQYIKEQGISEEENSTNAIWQVGRGDGEYLQILSGDGSVLDWNFIALWIKKEW
jgi:hypothetical protein